MIESVVMPGWEGYELLDSGNGQRLERFGHYFVVRPDPNVLWPKGAPDHEGWQRPDAQYVSRERGWEGAEALLAEGWTVQRGSATFRVKPTPFRHTGLFPEQAAHWSWLEDIIERSVNEGYCPKVLNVFAYTGAASVTAAMAGAEVCHVDASKGSVMWAKENARLSGLPDDSIRWIVDDAAKFLRREVRRGSRYDVVMMDPPVFGRGPKGEIWRLEEQVSELAELCAGLLSKKALGVLVNFYATTLYPQSVARIFQPLLPLTMRLGSLDLLESQTQKTLPTGFFLRS